MPKDTPPPLLVDAVKASALKLREKQAALDARAKELEVLKARLEAERADLENRAARLAADREAIDRERQGLDDTKASMERDLAAINEGRERLMKDEETLRQSLQNLEAREKTLRADEARVQRLEQTFMGPMRESESKLHDLVEHEQELTRLQKDWLVAIEARERELRVIAEQMQTRQSEALQQHESLAVLRNGLKAELERLLGEQEKLSAKEKSIRDAEEALASALQLEGADLPEAEPIASPSSAPATAEPAAPEPAPQAAPEAPAAAVQEELPPEIEDKPRSTKGEATERLSRAVEAWKRARDAGWKVGDIRKTVKSARDAIETGDYERAIRDAGEILEQLQATAPAK